MRENELEQRQMEAAKILAALNKQEAELYSIIDAQQKNKEQMETLYTLSTLDIQQIEAHRQYGLKLIIDEKNKERIINNTKILYNILALVSLLIFLKFLLFYEPLLPLFVF